jgi:hypothetical protein
MQRGERCRRHRRHRQQRTLTEQSVCIGDTETMRCKVTTQQDVLFRCPDAHKSETSIREMTMSIRRSAAAIAVATTMFGSAVRTATAGNRDMSRAVSVCEDTRVRRVATVASSDKEDVVQRRAATFTHPKGRSVQRRSARGRGSGDASSRAVGADFGSGCHRRATAGSAYPPPRRPARGGAGIRPFRLTAMSGDVR